MLRVAFRALSIVATNTSVARDMFYNGNVQDEPGAVVCRVSPSFVRFGSFQLPVSRGADEVHLTKKLADYVLKHHFPEFASEDKPYLKMLQSVVERTAELVVKWQMVGFVHGELPVAHSIHPAHLFAQLAVAFHVTMPDRKCVSGIRQSALPYVFWLLLRSAVFAGVLNTDNCSILGLTIDYGPYGFLDVFDPSWTPNLTDMQGRRCADLPAENCLHQFGACAITGRCLQPHDCAAVQLSRTMHRPVLV